MQKIRTYFQAEKENLSPKESDFLMILNNLESKSVKNESRGIVRSPFMLWGFASVSFAALVLMLTSVYMSPSQTSTVAMMSSRSMSVSDEALSTLDSVQSFNIAPDEEF